MLASLLILMVAIASPMPAPAASPPVKVTLGSEQVVVPLTFFHNRPVVEVLINGSGPFKFILDTGAGGSVLDLGLAEELNLPVLGKSMLGSPAGGAPVEANIVGIDEQRIGGVLITGGDARTADLSRVFGAPDSPRGVLSTAVFEDLLLTIDYPGERILLAGGGLPEPDGKDVMAYEEVHGLPAVPVIIAGKTYSLHMDTGSPSGVTLPASYIGQLPLESEPVEVGRAHMVDTEVVIRGARLKGKVRLGTFEVDNPRITFIEGPDVGNLGFEILGKFAITMDQKARRIRLSGPDAPPGG